MRKIDDTYLGNPLLKGSNIQIEFTKEQLEEYLKCSGDPVYFMENYMKIVTLDQGLTQIKLYDFQRDIVRTVHTNRFSICKIPRQSGKTTVLIGEVVHQVLFNPNYKVAILANKLKTATDIMDRVKLVYENLPKWMQQGVVEWNKTSVTLENGSKVVCSSTSSSAVRGSSYNFLLLDEFAFVPDQIAEDFFASVYPTITAGTTTKTVIVSTPNGLNLFHKLWVNAKNGRSAFVPVEAYWYQVPGRDEKFKAETIKNTSERHWASEYECEFLGSQDTLIKASKIASLAFSEPIMQTPDGLTIYENPKEGNLYMMMVDTSRAMGQDYHAFTVLDVTQVPYKVVARYRNNQVPAAVYPNVLYSVASKYNGSYVLVEINDIGQQVADILRDELEYDNMLEIVVKGKKGQKLGVAFGGAKTYNGVKMSASIKKMGCMALKEMIEGDKIILNDYEIISELSTYISKSNSYEASTGYHDDLVSTLVMFGWLTTQPYYKELVDLDIRKKIYEDKLKKIEEDLMPFGFVSAGDDNDQDEAVRLLSQEANAKKAPNRRDTSWLADAEELT
jgi:hypothetical protein